MRVFVVVVEQGSQTAAADYLEMSRAMVSRYLESLEGWLGQRLLQRTTRRLGLTAAGEECLRRCREVLAQVEALEQHSGELQSSPSGSLRITAPMAFGQQVLAGLVAEFVGLYPQVRVDMLMVDRTVNLVEDRVDLAIRMTNDLDPTLIARRLGNVRSVLCASPVYLKLRGEPRVPAELSQHQCLSFPYFERRQWHLSRAGELFSVPVEGNVSANESVVLLHAALAGAGITMQPAFMVAPYLASGALQAVLADYEPPTLGMYAVYTSRRQMLPALRVLLDFLAERLNTPSWGMPG